MAGNIENLTETRRFDVKEKRRRLWVVAGFGPNARERGMIAVNN